MASNKGRENEYESFGDHQGVIARKVQREMKADIPSTILTALLKHGVKDQAHEARILEAINRGTRVTTVELARMCKVSRRTIWAWIKAGRLPKPGKRGKRVTYWNYEDVKHLMT